MIKTGGLGVTDVVNNIMFIPNQVAASVSDEMAKIKANFVGNQVIAPYANEVVYGIAVLGLRTGGYDLYVKDNLGPYRTNQTQPDDLFVNPNGRSYVRSTRNPAPQITTTLPDLAYQQVLASSGAAHRLDERGEFVSARDSVDTRVVNDVKAGLTRMIVDMVYPSTWPALDTGTPYADSDKDGMADTWETIHFGSLDRGSPTDSSGDFDNDGYTDLEEFLNGTDPNPSGPSGSPTPSPTPTPIDTPISTPTPTMTPTPLNTPMSTSTPTNTPTPVPTNTPPSTPANLLANGDFELDSNQDARPDSWTGNSNFTRSNSAMYGGSYAGRHYATNNTEYTISQTVDVTGGKAHTFSGRVNIPPTSDRFTFKVSIRWLNNKGRAISTVTLKTYSASTSGWDQILANRTAPAKAVKAQVQMVVSSLKATIYVDDFNLY
jgi:hypothetical protein